LNKLWKTDIARIFSGTIGVFTVGEGKVMRKLNRGRIAQLPTTYGAKTKGLGGE